MQLETNREKKTDAPSNAEVVGEANYRHLTCGCVCVSWGALSSPSPPS